jgi:NAD(P)-dependent dehydrogenase (short-subunit alcohol dehydrogenase family)
MMRLDGRAALVTGAAGFLGTAIAGTLAELGASLILVDRPGSDLPALQRQLEAGGTRARSISTDLESADHRSRLLRELATTEERLSVVVNNAAFVGTSDLDGWSVPFARQTLETWRRALEVNLTAVFDLCQGVIPLMAAAAGKSIINVASIHGELGPDWRLYEGSTMASPAAYAASKGGLIQLTRWLATTAAPDVRVNAISPGGISRNQPESFVRRYSERTPLRRMATEDDMRGAIAYLATDLSTYVTGQNLRIDGGWSAW